MDWEEGYCKKRKGPRGLLREGYIEERRGEKGGPDAGVVKCLAQQLLRRI